MGQAKRDHPLLDVDQALMLAKRHRIQQGFDGAHPMGGAGFGFEEQRSSSRTCRHDHEVGLNVTPVLITLSGFERRAFIGQLAGLLVSVSITVMLVGDWGAIGAAVGALAGLLVWNIWMAFQLRGVWGGPFLFLLSGVGRDK